MSSKILMPQLVSMLSANSGNPKNVAETFLKTFFSLISDTLESHESIKIKDFGTFKITRVEARKSVNVATGEDFKIPPHYKINFVPSKNLAETVNEEFAWLDIVELSEDISNEELQELKADGINIEPSTSSANAVANQQERIAQSSQPDTVSVKPLKTEFANTTAAHPVNNSNPQKTKKEESTEESERLGEELEREFGDVEPVEPFGPIEPDDSRAPDPVIPPAPPKEDDFDPYAQDVKNELAPVDKNEIVLISKEEYANLPNRADIKAISKHIKRIKSTVVQNEEADKKRNLKYFLWGIVISLVLVTGGLFLLYGILMHNGFTLKKQQESTMSNSENTVGKNLIDDEQIDIDINNTVNKDISSDSSSQKPSAAPGNDNDKAGAKNDEAAKSKNETDASKSAATKSAEIKTMDKITHTRYLTTMAKEYYGNYNFWPYIYLENEGNLGHPDKIKPGTIVAIPNIQKYGVDPSNPKDIEKARKLGIEIYKKYGNN